MNSRLFLYSAFFFVTILLYDAYYYNGQGASAPADVVEESYRSPPSTDSATNDSDEGQSRSSDIDTRASQDVLEKTIDVESDNLKLKIS